MAARTIRCPSCGGEVRFEDGAAVAVCPYCDNEVALDPPKPPADQTPPAPEPVRPADPTPARPSVPRETAKEKCARLDKAKDAYIRQAKKSDDPKLRKLARRAYGMTEAWLVIGDVVLCSVVCALGGYWIILLGLVALWLLMRRLGRNLQKLAEYSSDFDAILRELHAAEAERNSGK